MKSKALIAAALFLSGIAMSGEDFKPPHAPKPPVPVPPATEKPTVPPIPPLYARVGGVPQIALLGEEFTALLIGDETLLANEKIKQAMTKSSKAVLRFHITALLCQVAGGPERYSGSGVLDLYNELNVNDKEIAAVSSALQKALEKVKSPAEQQKDWLEQADLLRKAILAAKANEPVEYVNKDKNFAISFPKSWERKENNAGATVVAFSPAEGENDSFREHAAVVVEDLPIDVTSEEYLKANVLASKHLVEMKILDTAPITSGTLSGHRMIYSHKLGAQELRVVSLYFVVKRRGYAVNCIAASDQAAKYLPLFENICRTFKLLDAPPAPVTPPPANVPAPK